MSWIQAIGAGFEVVSKWMSRAWGEQTSEQAALQKEVEDVLRHKRLAMAKVRDAEHIDKLILALDDLNYWDARLHELHSKAIAKWS